MFDSVLHRPMKCCCENYRIMLNRLKLKTKGLHIYDVHTKKNNFVNLPPTIFAKMSNKSIV